MALLEALGTALLLLLYGLRGVATLDGYLALNEVYFSGFNATRTVLAPGVELAGARLAATEVPDANACAEACRASSECSWINFCQVTCSSSNGGCPPSASSQARLPCPALGRPPVTATVAGGGREGGRSASRCGLHVRCSLAYPF